MIKLIKVKMNRNGWVVDVTPERAKEIEAKGEGIILEKPQIKEEKPKYNSKFIEKPEKFKKVKGSKKSKKTKKEKK